MTLQESVTIRVKNYEAKRLLIKTEDFSAVQLFSDLFDPAPAAVGICLQMGINTYLYISIPHLYNDGFTGSAGSRSIQKHCTLFSA